MSTLDFIASLVNSLAWPVAVVVVLSLFREQIKKLLRVPPSRLKAGPFEAEWDRTVAEAQVDLDQPDLPKAEVRSSTDVAGDLYELAERLPAAAVLEGYRRVEQALQRRLLGTVDELDPRLGATGLARLAKDLDLITTETVRAVEGISVLRNLAAHSTRGEVSVEQAREYLGIVEAILYVVSTWLRPEPPDET